MFNGFKPLVSFDAADKIYICNDLFPVFASRLPDCKRKDIVKSVGVSSSGFKRQMKVQMILPERMIEY